MLYPISDIKQTGGSYRLYNLQNDGHFCHGTGATAQPSFRSYITSTTECRTTINFLSLKNTYVHRSQIRLQGLYDALL